MASSSKVDVATLTGPAAPPPPTEEKAEKGLAFWLTFLAVVVSIFLSALDFTALGTALPTIVSDLKGDSDFVWVSSAYALSSTAVLPLSGSLADIFGRRPVMLGSIIFFLVGSAVSGSARSMTALIIARAIQGIGGGAIINLAEIICSDLVPLAERGVYQGMIGLTWALACGVGPPLGGVFAGKATWRWLFYLNLPLSGIALVLVWFFLRVRTPPGSMRSKLAQIDWTGNALIMAGTTLAIIGLTFGGIRFPWSSAQVLAPLIIGLCLIALFFWYEAKVPAEPTIPWEVVSNRVSLGGYVGTFIHGVVTIAFVYYIPVYFQAVFGASPTRAGVEGLPTALAIAFFALLAGVLTQVLQRYVPFNVAGHAVMMAGFGAATLFDAHTSTSKWIGIQFVAGTGIGLLYTATTFPILAPLPVQRTAAALAFFAFVRSFAQTWGITIASTILQNELKRTLPPAFVAQVPGGAEIAYAAIPLVRRLPEPLRTQVRAAFAQSIAVVWKALIGIAGAGLVSTLLLREVAMHTVKDDKYGLDVAEAEAVRRESASAEEKGVETPPAVEDTVV